MTNKLNLLILFLLITFQVYPQENDSVFFYIKNKKVCSIEYYNYKDSIIENVEFKKNKILSISYKYRDLILKYVVSGKKLKELYSIKNNDTLQVFKYSSNNKLTTLKYRDFDVLYYFKGISLFGTPHYGFYATDFKIDFDLVNQKIIRIITRDSLSNSSGFCIYYDTPRQLSQVNYICENNAIGPVFHFIWGNLESITTHYKDNERDGLYFDYNVLNKKIFRVDIISRDKDVFWYFFNYKPISLNSFYGNNSILRIIYLD